MSDYAWPAAWVPSAVSMVLVPNTRTFTSPYTGAQQTVDLLGERWEWQLMLPPCTRAEGMARQAFLNALRGASKTVSMGDLMRSAPTGTMRGTPTLAATAAQGAATLSIQASVGDTLNAGDKIGAGGQLFEVASGVVSDGFGVLTVAITSRARSAISSGAAVAWSGPTTSAILVGNAGAPVLFEVDTVQPTPLKFQETW